MHRAMNADRRKGSRCDVLCLAKAAEPELRFVQVVLVLMGKAVKEQFLVRIQTFARQLILLSYSFSMSSAGKIGNSKHSSFCLLVVFRGTKIRFLFHPHNTVPWKVTAFSPFFYS